MSRVLAFGVASSWDLWVRPGFVFSLLSSSSPAAILRFVITVIVNPLDCETGQGRLSHILNELNKRVLPFSTDFDASPSIPVIIFKPGIVASVFHRRPTAVAIWKFFCSVEKAMCRYGISLKTAATLMSKRPQISAANSLLIAALAQTKISWSSIKTSISPDYCHAAIFVSGNVNEFTHVLPPLYVRQWSVSHG